MNFKGFKKVHDDNEKTILKNEKGHSITLAKKGLSKGHLDGLSKLPIYAAEGTDVEDDSQMEDRQVPDPQPAVSGGGNPEDAPRANPVDAGQSMPNPQEPQPQAIMQPA